MRLRPGQLVRVLGNARRYGKRVRIIRPGDSLNIVLWYQVEILEDTKHFNTGDKTTVMGFALHPVSPLEELADA